MAEYRVLVPLFLTADITPKIIDNLLKTAPKAFDSTDEQGDGRNAAEFVIITEDLPKNISTLKSQSEGTRPPTSSFKSPYLNTSADDLAGIFSQHLKRLSPSWTESIFVIADSETAKEGKSVILAGPLHGESGSESVRVDFAEVLKWATHVDIGGASIPELLNCLGPEGYVTAEAVEEARSRGEAP